MSMRFLRSTLFESGSFKSGLLGTGLALAFAAGAFVPKVFAQVYVVDGQQAARCSQAAASDARDDGAIGRCTDALERGGLTGRDYAGTFVNRGLLRLRAGDLPAAMGDFDRGVTLMPSLGEAWLDRGAGRLVAGDDTGVIRDVSEALRLGSSHGELGYYLRAYARERSGDAAGAYLDYSRASRLAPRWDAPKADLARFEVRPR